MRSMAAVVLAVALGVVGLTAQQTPRPDWSRVDEETMRHFQALLRLDTSDPPGNEQPAADYLRQVLEKEGIPVQVFALEPNRANLVARLTGNGRKRPLLLMAHTDVVNVDPTKWTHPPFSATHAGGYVYGRGALDDKDNLTVSLITMLLLKRLNVPLDRDVIFLAEAGEEGSTRVGIQFMVAQHFQQIDAEYCLAEAGGVVRVNGMVRYAGVETNEKIPRVVELTAKGISGHASIPLATNPVTHLAAALLRVAEWQAPIRLNETTRVYFERLARISPSAVAEHYRNVLDPKRIADEERFLRANDPRHSALLRTTATPTILSGGYRVNVIPSEANATVDVRLLPSEDAGAILEMIRKAVNDPAVDVRYAPRDVRPAGTSRLDTEAFKTLEAAIMRHYGATTLPMMSAGATDMSYLRAKGVQCYGIGPATDTEDEAKGFGAHSDQERILESELNRFVRFNWDVVTELAASR